MRKRKRKTPSPSGCKNIGEQALREAAEWFRQRCAEAQSNLDAPSMKPLHEFYRARAEAFTQAAYDCDHFADQYRRKRKVST